MRLEKELVALAKNTKSRSLRSFHAACAGGVFGFATLLLVAILFVGSSCHEFEDVFFYILIPACLGAFIGTFLGLAIFLTITRTKVHPALAAMIGGILAPALAATLILVYLGMTAPEVLFPHRSSGVSAGLAAGFEAAWWLMIYLFIVLPVSIVAGAIYGCLLNRR